MLHLKVSGPLGFALFFLLLSASVSPWQAHAQTAPAAGASVAVKMVDAVDSGTDPAGKQYRASVSKPVDAGNGVIISQGSAAIVTLSRNGTAYAAQLSSVTINGQPVAVASSSASVTNSAQSAASSAASAVGSVLGGFGRRVNAPTGAAAVATGQRVVLPPGVTLTFILSQPPALNTAAAQPVTPPAQPAAAPVSSPAATSSASASGTITTLAVCYSNQSPYPSDPNNKTLYLSAAFEAPADRYSDATLAFSNYLKATYRDDMGVKCLPMFTTADARAAQTQLGGFAARLKPIDTGWRLGQPALTAGQAGFDPLAQGPGGIDLSQHRLTTYFCSYTGAITSDPIYPNKTTYVTQLFQADWNATPVSTAYNVFIRDRFVHDINMADLSPRCSAQSPAMQTMQHQTAMISNKRIGKTVAVDFAYTPAQAAAANTSAVQAAVTPTTPSTAGQFISCSTSGEGGAVIYLTGIFQTTRPVKHMPNGAKIIDQSIVNDFYAYLTQKGYSFKPSSSQSCDVSPTEAAAQTAQNTRVHGSPGSCGFCGAKVVETGWKEK